MKIDRISRDLPSAGHRGVGRLSKANRKELGLGSAYTLSSMSRIDGDVDRQALLLVGHLWFVRHQVFSEISSLLGEGVSAEDVWALIDGGGVGS